MYDFIHKHKRLLEIILVVLIVPPFALFGVDWYFRGNESADQVASVGKSRITQQEFGQALRQRQEQFRQMAGGKADQAMLDSPEMRRVVLDQLIDERVSYTAALKSGITVPVSELQAVIAEIPAFKDANGKFSPERYRDLLRAQGMTEGSFEASLRKDLIINRNRELFSGTAFLPNAVVDRLYKLRKQQREVSQIVLEPAQYAAQVKLSDDEIKAYYNSHKQEFELPEKVKLEYVMLTQEAAMKQVSVSDDELKKAFEERNQQQQNPEERRASHILVAVPQNATPEQKSKAKQKAQALFEEAKKSPKSFAELAKKNSEDPGSAVEGGDLGWSPRGRMVKPFDDALFSMKVGDITGPVETQFGYHVIKLNEIKTPPKPSFEAMKPKLEEELRKSAAARVFAQQADDFSNLVYDQPDSLKPAADKFKLNIQTSGWVTRQGGGDMPLLNNDKLMRAIFSDNAIKRHQNTEAVEVAPNVMIAARVVAHEPAKQRPLEEVKPQIVAALTQEKAGELARKAGDALLDKLRKGGEAEAKWSAPQTVTRESRAGLHPEAAAAVFSADASKLPAYVGLPAPDSRYVIYKISKVIDVDSIDPEQRKQIAKQLEPIAGQENLAARVENLKQNADVKVDAKKLEKAG
jgi:peptidyl-prolyl cis-trans isomerase D